MDLQLFYGSCSKRETAETGLFRWKIRPWLSGKSAVAKTIQKRDDMTPTKEAHLAPCVHQIGYVDYALLFRISGYFKTPPETTK
jgi:hypothetical protein